MAPRAARGVLLAALALLLCAFGPAAALKCGPGTVLDEDQDMCVVAPPTTTKPESVVINADQMEAVDEVQAVAADGADCDSPALFTAGVEPGHVAYLEQTNFTELVEESKFVWLIKFYGVTCGHCVQMENSFKELAALLPATKGYEYVRIGEIACNIDKDIQNSARRNANMQVCHKYSGLPWPALILFTPDIKGGMPAFHNMGLQASRANSGVDGPQKMMDFIDSIVWGRWDEKDEFLEAHWPEL